MQLWNKGIKYQNNNKSMNKNIYITPETEMAGAVSFLSDILTGSGYGEAGQDLEMLDELIF